MDDWLDDIPPGQAGLRYYQRDAVDALKESLQQYRSSLCVMATGTGKTQVGATLAKEWDGNVLWLAHRDELVVQARRRLEEITGEWVDLEQGKNSQAHNARIVVGSVQTVQRDKRLERLGKDKFSLIIPDEFHHYVARTYRKVLDYFGDAKIAGLTATPDRADEIALGAICDDVPDKCVFDLLDAIEAGYLVPIEAERVHLDSIDLSHVSKSKGDLAIGQLDEVMVKSVEGICKQTLEAEPHKRGICFFPGVKSAELACERFNALLPNSAICISAKTNPDLRRELVDQWKMGKFQYFCNVQIATEGFDSPDVAVIVQGRPTLSRALYSQMVGRGSRPLPGLVDALPGPSMAEERRSSIAASPKPNMKVLDFVGNGGKHQLISPVDIFAGKYSEPERKLAKKKEKEDGGDPAKLLEMARQELIQLAKDMASRVQARREVYDPFASLGVEIETKYTRRFGFKAASPKQRRLLGGFGIEKDYQQSLSFGQAGKLLDKLFVRVREKKASYKQMKVLEKWGVTSPDVTFAQAGEAISYIKSTGWSKQNIDNGYLDGIIHRQRQPGED